MRSHFDARSTTIISGRSSCRSDLSRVIPFYQIGGTLPADIPSYVERGADTELYREIRAGKFCYVLTTRQRGKSSLMIRTAERLRADGARVAIVDLTGIGATKDSFTADQWYYGIAANIVDQLGLNADLDSWWKKRAELPSLQRLIRFLRDIVLANTAGPVVIFVDEIDSSLGLPFAADFFAGIRACLQFPGQRLRVQPPTFRPARRRGPHRTHRRSQTYAFQYRHPHRAQRLPVRRSSTASRRACQRSDREGTGA